MKGRYEYRLEQFYSRVSRVSKQRETLWLLIILPVPILFLLSLTIYAKSIDIKYGAWMGVLVIIILFFTSIFNFWHYRFIRLSSQQVKHFDQIEYIKAKLTPYIQHHLNKGMGSTYYGIKVWVIHEGKKQVLLYPFLQKDIQISQSPLGTSLRSQIQSKLNQGKPFSGSYDARNRVILNTTLDFEQMINRLIKKSNKQS